MCEDQYSVYIRLGRVSSIYKLRHSWMHLVRICGLWTHYGSICVCLIHTLNDCEVPPNSRVTDDSARPPAWMWLKCARDLDFPFRAWSFMIVSSCLNVNTANLFRTVLFIIASCQLAVRVCVLCRNSRWVGKSNQRASTSCRDIINFCSARTNVRLKSVGTWEFAVSSWSVPCEARVYWEVERCLSRFILCYLFFRSVCVCTEFRFPLIHSCWRDQILCGGLECFSTDSSDDQDGRVNLDQHYLLIRMTIWSCTRQLNQSSFHIENIRYSTIDHDVSVTLSNFYLGIQTLCIYDLANQMILSVYRNKCRSSVCLRSENYFWWRNQNWLYTFWTSNYSSTDVLKAQRISKLTNQFQNISD